MMVLLELFISFLKIGFTSFGGLSMIPLITSEMTSHGWMTAAEVSDMLARRCRDLPALPCGDIFTGMLHNRLGRMLARYARLDAAAPLSSLSPARLQAAADAVKGFSLRVTGTEGFDSAQVTAGGIRTSGFDPETLQSWFMPRLFVCGELLDIDGDCGGYNLQWAWASGRLAGRLGE